MKFNQKFVFYLNIFYIIVTGLVNLFGYFTLPDTIATQFSFSGEVTNHTSKSLYLVLSFVIILLLSLAAIKKEDGQKLKFILVNSLIVIVNIIVILMQI